MSSRYEGTIGMWTTTPEGRMFSRCGASMPVGGRLVLLVHGLVVSSSYMVPLIRAFAPRCRVYALDLPGYGRSYRPEIIPTIPRLADYIATWMDAEKVEQASLVGNSLGCQIITEFCLRHPGRVDRVVLQGPTVNPEERNFPMQLLRQMQNLWRERPGVMLDIVKDYASAGVPRIVETVRMTLGDAIEERLPHLDLPVLVLAGERDPVAPPAWAQQVVRLLPRGELVVIPGVGHIINWSFPERFVEAAAEFLRI
jgi:2-hydroxy-6-oxonona-2,4-dienedioate hydrolase